MKDEAVTEAPKEDMTILFYYAALFRRNTPQNCKNCKTVLFGEGQIQSSFCLMILFHLKLPLSTLANLIFNSKYFVVLLIQSQVHIQVHVAGHETYSLPPLGGLQCIQTHHLKYYDN